MEAHNKLAVILGGIAALGGLAAILTYADNHKIKDVQAEVLDLDRQIKALELYRKQRES